MWHLSHVDKMHCEMRHDCICDRDLGGQRVSYQGRLAVVRQLDESEAGELPNG